jgi:hypothetical protein
MFVGYINRDEEYLKKLSNQIIPIPSCYESFSLHNCEIMAANTVAGSV